MSKRQRIVVVGHGMVGHRFAQAAVERGLTETHDVVIFGEEPRAAYDRVALTSWFGHETGGADALSLLPGGEEAPADERAPLPLKERVQAYERGLVVEALREARGNRSEAARRLGVSRVTLHDKLRRYGLGDDDAPER